MWEARLKCARQFAEKRKASKRGEIDAASTMGHPYCLNDDVSHDAHELVVLTFDLLDLTMKPTVTTVPESPRFFCYPYWEGDLGTI